MSWIKEESEYMPKSGLESQKRMPQVGMSEIAFLPVLLLASEIFHIVIHVS